MKWKRKFKQGVGILLVLWLLLPGLVAGAAEYTAIETGRSGHNTPSGGFQNYQFPIFTQTTVASVVFDYFPIIGYSKTTGQYNQDWIIRYNPDQNTAYLILNEGSSNVREIKMYMCDDTESFSNFLKILMVDEGWCELLTTESKKILTVNWGWSSSGIGPYDLYWEGIHALLESGAADGSVKRILMRSLDFYGSDAALPINTLSVGDIAYEVLDTTKLPLTLVAEESTKHAAVTLAIADNDYRILYGNADITSIVSQLGQEPDSCGLYWKAVAYKLNECQTNYTNYLNAVNQQGTTAAATEYNTAYDYYAARIANYWLNGDANGVLADLQKYPGTVAVKAPGKGVLTKEEKLRLQVFASILSMCGDARYKGNINDLLTKIPDLQWQLCGSLSPVSVTNSSNSILTMDMLDNDWTKLYGDKYRDYTAVANQALEGELVDAYAVAVYYAAKMYGASTSTSSAEIGNLGVLPQSEYIESITMNINSSGIDMLNLNFASNAGSSYYGIPAMTKIDTIAGTEEAHNAYYNLNLLLAAIASYCNTNSQEFEIGNNGWVDELLDADASNIVNLSEYSILKDNINKVQACININETLTYLGVDTNWLSSVKTVCAAGNALQAYKDIALQIQAEYVANESEPMKTFFNLSRGTYATDYLTGVALSATFKPMQTNMYDVQSVSFVEDTDWVTRFHYPWGFYRKALYIDTDTSAAVNRYITSSGTSKGNTRIATLGDLLEPEKDIVLYIDDKFYNTDELANKMGLAYNKLQNAEETAADGSEIGLIDKLKETFDVDVESIVKTGGNTAYSRSVQKHVAHVGEQKELSDFVDGSLLDLDTIAYQLRGYSDEPTEDYAKQYTVLQSYAVVSSIYRDPALYSKVSRLTGKSPAVFVSSPNLFAIDGVSQSEFNSIYNYAMLKNLEDALPIDYKSQLDLTEPLYIDIYGNILTDSGTVVIPAMSNASLCGSDFNPVTVGFMYLYNKGNWKIPGDANNCDLMLSESFSLDGATGEYMLTNQRFNNVRINLAMAQLSDEGVIKMLYEVAQDNCNIGGYLPFDNHVYWITEVLRGAPLEFIDKDAEMITTPVNYSKLGITIANKLNEVIDAFYAEEHKVTLLSLPNLAFMDGFEYVILYLFKIVFVTLFVMLVYRLYIDAVGGSLGFKSVLSFIMSVVMFLVTCFAVPTLLDVSYYQVNKKLLKDEALQTVMLDTEKKAEGREIGISGVQSVQEDSKLYLKVDDLSVPWYVILDDVLVSDTSKTLDNLYEEEFQNSYLANLPRFERQGQNLYIDVEEVMRNSVLTYDKEYRIIQSAVKSTPYESFVTPYYAVLDTLVCRINVYNSENDLNNFDTKIMAGGQVKTVGLIAPYLLSEDFMSTSRDPAGIRDIYGLSTTLTEATAFSEDDRDTMSQSYWYADLDDYSEKTTDRMITEIDNEARHFVTEYRALLNKISDESFLEVMALSIACKHNDVFDIHNADSLEIFDIDNTSIIRLSVAPMQTVIAQCSKSFSRFIYDNGGMLGVIAMAFLLLVYIVASVIKTVCLYIMIACLFMSVVIRRLVKKDSNSAVEGYMVTMAIICICNVAFSLVFKVSLFLPNLGLSITASALVQIVLQCAYVFLLGWLTMIVVQDWRNAGFERYAAMAVKAERAVVNTGKQTIHSASMKVQNRRSRYDDFEDDISRRERAEALSGYYTISGADILREMQEKDVERRQHAKQK